MDTFIEVSVYSLDRDLAVKAMDEIFKELSRIEKVFSNYDEESEVSRINALSDKKRVVVSSELFELVERSLYYSKISEGKFDIVTDEQGNAVVEKGTSAQGGAIMLENGTAVESMPYDKFASIIEASQERSLWQQFLSWFGIQ